MDSALGLDFGEESGEVVLDFNYACNPFGS